jgi:hypothetical protein
VFSVVPDKDGQFFCVHAKNEEIPHRKFDNATEICCSESGTHNKTNNMERKLGCCEGKNYDKSINFLSFIYNYNTY